MYRYIYMCVWFEVHTGGEVVERWEPVSHNGGGGDEGRE